MNDRVGNHRLLYSPLLSAGVSLLVAGCSMLFAGCGSGESVTILKAALSQNPSEPQVRAVELFSEMVSEGTAGRIRVQIYPNNQLGNQRDVVEGLQMGSVEMANIASVMASFVPEINLFELPFLFDGPEHFDAVVDSEIGRSLAPAFEGRGLHLLGYFDVGERHIMTTDHPVERLEDLSGLKIRTMENRLHLATFEAFGANPLPMAYGELYTALEQGVIDGRGSSTGLRLRIPTTLPSGSMSRRLFGRESVGSGSSNTL